jgi:HlyD family secretion protein
MTTSAHLLRFCLLSTLLALAGCDRPHERAFQGWVEADLVFIAPDEPGRVTMLGVREGDSVATGTPLFALDDDLQNADVSANEAAVKEARARLARAEAQQQRPAEIAVLEAQKQRAVAMLALSTAELERQRQLAEKNVSSKAQLDIALANYNRDEAALEEIQRQIVVARLSSREEDIAAAKQALAAAEARLESTRTRLQRRRIASPVTGTVRQLYYRPGEMVPSGRPVLALLPPANLKLRFFVPEARLPEVALGASVRVRCDGCENDLTARISFISRTAEYTPPVVYTLEERAKLVFLVEARPSDPERLRVGQPARVELVSMETRR